MEGKKVRMKEILSMKIAANITYINKKPVIEFGDHSKTSCPVIPVERCSVSYRSTELIVKLDFVEEIVTSVPSGRVKRNILVIPA